MSADEVLLKRKHRFTHLQNFKMLLAICEKKLAIFASIGNYFRPWATPTCCNIGGICIMATKSYRPGWGEMTCPRLWRIYVRPRTGPQSVSLCTVADFFLDKGRTLSLPSPLLSSSLSLLFDSCTAFAVNKRIKYSVLCQRTYYIEIRAHFGIESVENLVANRRNRFINRYGETDNYYLCQMLRWLVRLSECIFFIYCVCLISVW